MIEVTAQLGNSFKENADQQWCISGLTSDMLMTMYAGVELQLKTLQVHIAQAQSANGKTYGTIAQSVYLTGKDSFFQHSPTSDLTTVYRADEDLLFLYEEARKCSEIMFRIRTEPGVF